MNRRTFIGVLAAPLIPKPKAVPKRSQISWECFVNDDLGVFKPLNVENLRNTVAMWEKMVSGAPMIHPATVLHFGEPQ